MELIFVFVVVLLLLAVFSAGGGIGSKSGGGVGLLLGSSGGHDSRLAAAAAQYGVTLRNTYLIHSGGGGRYEADEHVYGFSGVDKGGVEVTGKIRIGSFRAEVTFDSSGAGARAARAQGRLVEEDAVDESTLDPEEQIRREVARRLDALQADRGAFLSNDTDGDGMVDADEWAEARARIEAEVRAELLGVPPTSPDTPAAAAPPPGDGQW